MRNLIPVSAALVIASGIVSVVLWRDLQAERQTSNDLRQQLADATVGSAPKPVAPTAPAPQPPAEVAASAPAAGPTKAAREAVAALAADSIKQQKVLLEDPGYRTMLLTQQRTMLKNHYSKLGVELGLSEKETDALFDLLAERQLKASASMTEVMGGGPPTNAAEVAQMQARMQQYQQEQKQSEKDAVTAMLGPDRAAQFEDYDHIQPSRGRVNNLTALLDQGSQPLTDAQTRSLTAVIAADQMRVEAEMQALRDAGQPPKLSPADQLADTNSRILKAAADFLNPQQLEMVKGRFQQRNAIARAAAGGQ